MLACSQPEAHPTYVQSCRIQSCPKPPINFPSPTWPPQLIYDTVHSRVPAEELAGGRGGKGSKAAAAHSTEGFEVGSTIGRCLRNPTSILGHRASMHLINLSWPPPSQPTKQLKTDNFRQGVAELFPPGLFDDGRPGRGPMCVGWEATSGKFALCARMLGLLWDETDDRCVCVRGRGGEGCGEWWHSPRTRSTHACMPCHHSMPRWVVMWGSMQTEQGLVPGCQHPALFRTQGGGGQQLHANAGPVWHAVPRARLALPAPRRLHLHLQAREAGEKHACTCRSSALCTCMVVACAV